MSFQKFAEECKKIAGAHGQLLEKPPKDIDADLALPCFSLAKQQKRNPVEIAAELAKEFSKKIKKKSLVEKVTAKGPYVNFHINYVDFSENIMKDIISQKNKYGAGNKKGKIIVEYSGPNTNKPLHLGHLRNDSIGMAVSNILAFNGYAVTKTNIINDRGVHICKSMFAYKKWGKDKPPNTKSDHFVGEFYVMYEKEAKKHPKLEEEIHEMLQKWEKNDKETHELWKKMNEWSINGIKETYKKFGSEFDLWPLESEFYDKAKPILDEGLKKGIFFKNEKGDLVAKLEPTLPNKVVLRADGTSVYMTNDIALTSYRFEKLKADRAVWVVASEQNLHFKQLFKIFELIGRKWHKNCYHLAYGLVNLPSGRMKTREGNVVDADTLIDEVTQLAKKELIKREDNIEKLQENEINERALDIALAAIKYMLLKTEPMKDILFDPGAAISFEGDTGPYLQYTYARAKSIMRKSGRKPKLGVLFEQKEQEIVKHLSRFPDVVEKSCYAPYHLANYTFQLASLFNEYYHESKVIGAPDEEQKLVLVEAVAIVLANSLKLMNIRPLEKM